MTVQLMSWVVLDFGIHMTLDPLDHGHDLVNWPDPNFSLTFLAEVKMAMTPLVRVFSSPDQLGSGLVSVIFQLTNLTYEH